MIWLLLTKALRIFAGLVQLLAPLIIIITAVAIGSIGFLTVLGLRNIGLYDAIDIILFDVKNLFGGVPMVRPEVTLPSIQSLLLIISLALLVQPTMRLVSENFFGSAKPELKIKRPSLFENVVSLTDRKLGEYFSEADEVFVFGGDYSYIATNYSDDNESKKVGNVIVDLCGKEDRIHLFTNKSRAEVFNTLSSEGLQPEICELVCSRVVEGYRYDFKASLVRIQSNRFFIYIDERGPDNSSSLAILADEKHSRPVLDFIQFAATDLKKQAGQN